MHLSLFSRSTEHEVHEQRKPGMDMIGQARPAHSLPYPKIHRN